VSRAPQPLRAELAKYPLRLEDLSGQNGIEGIASLPAADRWHDW
jgi:hypothetical protein